MSWFGRFYKGIWPCEHTARVPPRPQLLSVCVRNDDIGAVVGFFSEIYTCNQGLGDIWDAWVKGLLTHTVSKLAFALCALELKTKQHKNAEPHSRLRKWDKRAEGTSLGLQMRLHEERSFGHTQILELWASSPAKSILVMPPIFNDLLSTWYEFRVIESIPGLPLPCSAGVGRESP